MSRSAHGSSWSALSGGAMFDPRHKRADFCMHLTQVVEWNAKRKPSETGMVDFEHDTTDQRPGQILNEDRA